MAQIVTSNFLPEAFRTPANQKFLNATLDQLVTQPDLRNINGYVGRKFAPTFKSTDNYVPEPTAQRQNYQLEPSIVVKNPKTNNVDFFSSYIDLVNQVGYSGGFNNNHDRLFKSEYYSYDGLFDFDKFVNFTQYYWLENGPGAVLVYGSEIPAQQTFIVTRNPATGTYNFSTTDGVENPVLRLGYGGTYQFVVNQPGFPFWIQTAPGVSGVQPNQPNISSRNVLGVTNNGTDVGTVTFTVPQSNAQDFYTQLKLAGTADLSTTLHYNQIQGKTLSSIVALQESGIDGVSSSYQLNLKSLIFVNGDLDASFWTVNGVTVPVANRLNAWEIVLSNDADPVVTLNPLAQAFTVSALQKVFVKGGATRAEFAYYLNPDYLQYNVYNPVPAITAPLTNLYYQDGVGAGYVGQIDLLVLSDTVINIDKDIVGAKTYKSPNGVVFSNGLTVTFDSSANPSSYAGNTYYVEGAGTAIKLLDVTSFETPEAYATSGLVNLDYLTINRAGADLNPWTRSNRWFHIDIINATSAYNNTTPVLDQNLRAKRPIIEFEPNVQLYNFGRVAKAPVDILNFSITDARNTVELQPEGYAIDGITLTQGMRVIFANDFDPTISNQIFVVNIVYVAAFYPGPTSVINLVPAEDYLVSPNNTVVVLSGAKYPYPANTATYYQFWFDGSKWYPAQAKNSVNQVPLFDVIDSNGYSLGDTNVYFGSTFAGTKIFSYTVGTGAVDSVLGFPLSYRNFNQIGDIQFTNNFDNDKFGYTTTGEVAVTDKNINTAGTLQQNVNLTSYNLRNSWTTNNEKSKQFQIISGIYDGNNPYFQIDITASSGTTVPYFRVYRNSQLTTGYSVQKIGINTYVYVTDTSLTTGDQIDILIYNKSQVSQLGYYEVPENLDYNSANANFNNLTLGQLRNHLSAMATNSNQVVGTVPGASNLRDVPVKTQGGSILQHASPVLYSEIFLEDVNANFLKGLNLARYEYTKLKNKIIELSTRTAGLDFTNIPNLLDTLLQNINAVKNKNFAWYYSDMVPYGNNYLNTLSYTVLNTQNTDYEISNIFSDTTLSNHAVLIYVNGVQLVKGMDYTFDTTRSGVTITYPLNIGDAITINEYNNTDGNYIPETPTKLGLYPKFTPRIYLDDTYQTPINVIQGHDGSITLAWGDYRDQLLLEFEKRIYNNIKVDYQKNVFDIYNFLPGKFRTTDYNKTEFTQLLTDSFLQWVGGNRVDYITNKYFVASEPFTWNYNQFVDSINGESLFGYWRAIYKYFYDTDRPDTCPWEMLGFSEMPAWWETRYGAAPYTGGNYVLWQDLQNGYIWNGGDSAAYTDSRFIRYFVNPTTGVVNGLLPDPANGWPGLIPVDDTGALRPPSEFAVKSFNSNRANGNFAIGDQGPVETAWRRSSDFAFAMQQAIALSAPAFYFGTLFDIGRYYKNPNLNQYVLSESLQRVTPKSIYINGTANGTAVYRAAGYTNWVAEYLRNQGIDPGTYLYNYLGNVNVQLAYKMAAYTDKTFIEVIAEQSSPKTTNPGVIIPNESYSIDLYKSTPVSNITYSAVTIEVTANGYSVSGFDFNQPYFTIIPSLANNNAYPVTVLNKTAVIYQNYQPYKVTVPYGFEFSNLQQVVDFLVSYQRYLQGIGIQFTDTDPDLGTQRDFLLSVQEFLTWSQQGWSEGAVLVLSPILNKLTVITSTGVVDQIQNTPNQSRILDTGYNFIKYNQLTVARNNTVNGNTFSVTANGGQTISLVKLDLVDYEHVMIFDNIDVFNDIIYVPELGNRQYRLKLVGKKTGSWTGAMNPPGFIYNSPTVSSWKPGTDYPLGSLVTYKNNYYTSTQDLVATNTFFANSWTQISSTQIQTGLLPNFSYNAEKFKRFNDIDDPETLGDFHLYSDSAIGFQPRDYMTNFGIDETTQAKFYQGFIKQKGSLNAITAFTAAGFNGITSNIAIYEEWGMRVGEYGALNNNRYAELVLTEGVFNGDPVTFTLLPNGASSSSNNIIGVTPNNLYLTSVGFQPNIYLNRNASSIYENDIATAGYVNINDVDTTIFNIGNYAQLSANIGTVGVGYTIWCAKDTNQNWNVYRVTETAINVVKMTYGVDNVGTVTFNRPHTFVYGDIIVVKGFDVRVDAFYQVYNVVDAYNISVVFYRQNADQIKSAMKISGLGPVFHLQSTRIKQNVDINSVAPLQGWINHDKLWVDNDYLTNGWAVYNKTTPWTGNVSIFNANMKLAGNYTSSVGFGTVTAIDSSSRYALAGVPRLSAGNVIAFVSNVANGNTFTQVANIGARAGDSVSNFGASLDTAGNLIYIGDPGNGISDYGRVHIHQFNGNASFPWTQTLTSPWSSNAGDAYGTSVSASNDGGWLYVSAPNAGNVYVYHANTSNYYSYTNTITIGSSAYAQFGHQVKATSNGRQVAISAPYQSVNNITAAGAVYVYDRSVETFIANGGPAYFTTYPVVASTVKVTLNGNVITTGFTTNSSAVTFTTAPVIGSVINVDTNNIQLLEQLTAPATISGAAFGLASWIAGNDADVYVASPGYSVPGYYSGIVYRFVNQGASYGTISSTNFSPVINTGDTLRINGIIVTISGNTVANVAANINSAHIPGVTATAYPYGQLTINSNVATPYQKLTLGPSSLLSNLGLSVFANVQSFQHPGTDDVNLFGSQIVSSPDGASLMIAASEGTTYNTTTFDKNKTVFDYNSTLFNDAINGSGMVYVYGLVNGALANGTPDQYTLIQRLQNNSLHTNDQFGYSIAMNANTLLVGAPGDSNSITTDPNSGLPVTIANGGTYYVYNNFTGNVGWDLIEQQQPQVDIESISRFYLYNNTNSTLITNLDYIDPAKGKVLGAAAEDLDYITAYDPAVYNVVGGVDSVPNLANSTDFHWGPAQVTKTWWNIDQVRYLNYEQGNLTYRANNWGATFPGSQIQVCEWVASDMPPSAYAGSGTPLYPDNSAYVVESTINPVTKMVTSTYYFWVYNKNSLELSSTHKNTVSTIQDIIANPQAQGIPYAAVLRSDTVSLHGISNMLGGNTTSGNTTVLHMDYDTLKNTNIIHSEYQLVQEGNSGSPIPTRIINKMIDSLSGVDMNGFAVPSANLTPQSSIGLGVNPNQTLFVNRLTALENFVEYVNGILIQHPIVEEFNISALYDAAPLPDAKTYDLAVDTHAELSYIDTTATPVGYTVLVLKDETEQGLWYTYSWTGTVWSAIAYQSYYTPFYWNFVNWYDNSYNPTVLPTFVVNTVADLATISPVAGNTIKVLNNGNNQFVIYRYNADGTSSLVGIQNGTIQFDSSLYTTTVAANEIRIIFKAIQNNIFIDELEVNFNDLFFYMINYILTEQPAVDWVFKTSFISVLHQLRKLNQPANYIPDNQTYYEQYINEVKPYRTSIRQYLIDYQGNDEYYGDTTDFDIPPTFIAGAYTSPMGTATDLSPYLSTLPQYSQWYNNYTYGISEVLVAHPGNGSNVFVESLTTTANVVVNYGDSITQPYSSASGNVQINTIDNIIDLVNVSGTFITTHANLYLDTAVTVAAGNTITQLSTGATGTAYVTSTGNVVTLINLSAIQFANVATGNAFVYNNGANLSANVTAITITGAYLYANGANLGVYPTATTGANQIGGYTLIPTVTVVGGGGTGANVAAVVDYTTGYISQFEVIAPGTGYTSTPTILINGTGTGAAGYPVLRNRYLIESLPTTILTTTTNNDVYTGNIIMQANTGAYGTVYNNSHGNTITLIDVAGTFTTNHAIYRDYANLNSNVSSVTSYTQFVDQSYNFVRNIDTTLKFDRTAYTSNVIVWQPNITVAANSYVSYNGQAYKALQTVYSSAILSLSGNVSANIGNYVTQANTTANATVIAVSSNLSAITVANLSSNYTRRWGNIAIQSIDANVVPVAINNVFDYSKYQLLSANTFTNAADRITAYYQPTASMPGRDLSQLMTGIGYPGVEVTGVKFNANTSILTNSNVLYAFANTLSVYSSNVSVVDFTTLGYTVGQPLTIKDNSYNREYVTKIVIISSDQLVATGISQDITLGSNITLSYYDFTNPTYLDSSITNSYKNTTFGSNIGDTTLDGGAYYDTYSSHAPEELVPGATFDNLNMMVTTKLQSGTSMVSYLIEYNMQANASSQNTKVWPKYYGVNYNHITTLTANLNITDSNIHVANAQALTPPNLNNLTPGVVYINGEKITFWTVDYNNNVLGQIRRAVDGTGAPAVSVAGNQVLEVNTPELIPGGNLVHTNTWLNAPPGISKFIVDEYNTQIVANVGGVLESLATIGNISGAVTDGSGLEGAIFSSNPTVEAAFLRTLIKPLI